MRFFCNIYKFILFISFSFLLSSSNSHFSLISKDNNISSFHLDPEFLQIKDIDGKKHIADYSEGADDFSFYPSQSTFYYLEDGVDIRYIQYQEIIYLIILILRKTYTLMKACYH